MNACVHNLNWTHFRALLRVSDKNARLWYMNEAAQEGWSSRTLNYAEERPCVRKTYVNHIRIL